MITNTNQAIFDSTDRSLSYLSKNSIFPNFSPQFIVQFDQIPKDISKYLNSLWIRPLFTIIPFNSLLISQIGKFGIIFDAIPREIDDLAVSSRQDAATISLSQEGYIKKILSRFNMEKVKLVRTPLSGHFKLSASLSPKTQEDIKYMAKIPYSSAVGSLMYAMICTRPDISQAVSLVSRYMANPGREHWKAVQWIFRFLQGTKNNCIHFGKSIGKVTGYVDSDYAGDLDKRRSLTGLSIHLWRHGHFVESIASTHNSSIYY